MNKQTALNRNWRHFVTDQQPCSTLSGRHSQVCVYQSRHNPCLRCGVGLILPAPIRRALGQWVGSARLILGKLRRKHPRLADRMKRLNREVGLTFMLDLQQVHDIVAVRTVDESLSPEQRATAFRVALTTLALRYGLQVPQAANP